MSDRDPPRVARQLLERRLPPELADAVVGDLVAEYRAKIEAGGSPWMADLWFWGQLVTLRAGSLRRGARRLAAIRPTNERNRPGRAFAERPDTATRLAAVASDVRYALRRLLKTPGFTAVAILSLALGIGANTAMFSIVNAVLLRELPLRDAEELVEIYSSDSDGFQYATSSFPDYVDVRARTDVFQNVLATQTFIGRMDLAEERRVVFGELVSWDYFTGLGVPMEVGRSFVEEEGRTPGTHPVVILGYRAWQRDFGGDPDVLGQEVRLNGRSYTVVGVAPEAFTGSMPVLVTGFYVPLMMTDVIRGSEDLARRGRRSMFMKGRLQPGVTIDQANAALRSLSVSLQERHPDTNTNRELSALDAGGVSIHPSVDRILTPVAGLLLGVVGLVLLIACANLASFLLARAEDRRKEIAIRLAMGAGRGRLVGQLLVETIVLAAMGGVGGVALAHWTVQLMMALRPPLPVPVAVEISLDGTVLAFTAAVSVAAGIAFGLAPALQATNPDVAPTLKNEATGGGGRKRFNLRSALVTTQVAFSFVLLIGAGLFVRSLQKAQLIDPGFDTGPGALVWPMPELSGYDTPDEVRALYGLLEERLLAHPRVTGVALADRLPLGVAVQTNGYLLPGVPSETPDGDHDIDDANVNAAYFDVMGVDIVQGRGFGPGDLDGGRVVVVSEAFRNRYYPGEDIVGRALGTPGGDDLRIIGVAEDTKVRTLGEDPRPFVYRLQGQVDFFAMQMVVKGEGTSEELVAIAREVLDEVDPDLVLFEEIKTMNEHLELLLFPPRMAALLLSAFGALALLLAAVGIYGVVSYAVSKRTRELWIRMSLGASARDVVVMAIGGGMRLVLLGGVVGVVLAAAVTWGISGYLFGVSTRDVVTFVTIPALLTGVALVAAWVPARRASRVDPVRALRTD
jgi:macrolide transport system ATP-binding/permease protein